MEQNKFKNTPRYLALELLTKIQQQGTYSNLGLNQVLQQKKLTKRDANLLTNLVYGVLQHQLTLQYYLAPFIRKGKKIDPWVKQLLLLAIYQLEYLDKIPKRAVFNETIEIAKIKGHVGVRKFVTGILHEIDRQGLPKIEEIQDVKQRLSIASSTPIWLVEQLITEVGLTKTQSILATINQSPAQSVRVNEAKITKQVLIEQLQEKGIIVHESLVSTQALRLENTFVPETSFYQDGFLTVQDESAMLAVEALAPTSDDLVLDACAAPGGKTVQLAEALTTGKVYALDIHQHKVNLIKQNAKRSGVAANVTALALDARQVADKFSLESFTKILVDAPCSGIGLMRRKPEVKYAKSLQDSQNLQKIQGDILDAIAPTLKKDGMLVYSTCTILQGENQAVVDKFLKRHPEFEQVKTQTKNNLKAQRDELSLTIYPDDYLTDGFFIATLHKKK